MKILVLSLFVLLIASVLPRAQQRWTRTYVRGERAGAHSVQQTSDGGYIVAGYINGSSQFRCLPRQDQCLRRYGLDENPWRTGQRRGVLCPADPRMEGYIVVGYTSPLQRKQRCLPHKTDSSGDTMLDENPTVGGQTILPTRFSKTSDGGLCRRRIDEFLRGRQLLMFTCSRPNDSPGIRLLDQDLRRNGATMSGSSVRATSEGATLSQGSPAPSAQAPTMLPHQDECFRGHALDQDLWVGLALRAPQSGRPRTAATSSRDTLTPLLQRHTMSSS